MIELQQGDSALSLSEDLSWLEYRKGGMRLGANSPFLLDWTGIPISLATAGEKSVTQDGSCIRIEVGDFAFPARFPGNAYCRPDKRYVPDFRFSLGLSLDSGDLLVSLSAMENLGDCEVRLLVLSSFFTASSRECAQLVLPVDYGVRIDFPRTASFTRCFQPSVSWSLPVHGLFRSFGGVGLWCDDPDRDMVVSCNGGTVPSVSAVCRQLYGPMANGPRSMRFMLFERGSDFRDLGRRCRELRQASGRFKTLRQKAAEHPEVAKLPGTVLWKHNVYYGKRPEGLEHSYSLYVAKPTWNENEGLPNNWTAEEVFRTAHERGFDRVAICNTGWNRDGFDAGYPARLPINPERGTEADVRRAAELGRSLSDGFTLSVHDNYIDAYGAEEYDESEMLQREPGLPLKTSVWRGGQAHWLCSKHSLKYARRDLPEVARIMGRGCIYLDVMAGVALSRCFGPGHQQSRREDWETKREVFKVAKECCGALAVEGCGTDHYADLVDIGSYGGLHMSLQNDSLDPTPVPVPLWQMVYHDSVLNYLGEGYCFTHGSEYRLYQALYTLLPTSFNEEQKRLSLDLRNAYVEALTDFEDLIPRTVTRDPDGAFHTHGVARSAYGDGTEVIVNFNESEFKYGDLCIPARDYVVLKAR